MEVNVIGVTLTTPLNENFQHYTHKSVLQCLQNLSQICQKRQKNEWRCIFKKSNKLKNTVEGRTLKRTWQLYLGLSVYIFLNYFALFISLEECKYYNASFLPRSLQTVSENHQHIFYPHLSWISENRANSRKVLKHHQLTFVDLL